MDRSKSATTARLRSENATLRQYLDSLGDIALAGEVPLHRLLQRIVETAQRLLSARYAALGVFDASGRVSQFYTTGISAEERARIGALPHGDGLLGLIVSERRIIRAPRISDHPASVGFPPHHPPMTSFLGGPIVRGDVVYGNLYLADRIGAAAFSEADEDLLALLARQAAVAIENAERFARVRTSERTTRALFEVGRALSSTSSPSEVIDLVVGEARRLLNADVAGLAAPDPTGKFLEWTVLQGACQGFQRESRVPIEGSIIGQVIRSQVPLETEDVRSLLPVVEGNPLLMNEEIRALVAVPFAAGGRTSGALVAGWRRPGALPEEAREVLDRLADRASIAITQAELHAREQAALQRSQIERSSLEAIFDSMHDAVITTDLAGRIVRINRQASQWAGCPASAAVGRAVDEVFHVVDDVGRPAGPDGVELVESSELQIVRPNGERFAIELTISPIRGADGQTLGAVRVLRDLRPQREVEQLKANIISLVSHELRTPLSHIKGYASSLLQPDVEWDAATRRDFIASIERQADRLARLIGDLLEISSLDAGGTARLEPVAIAPSVLVDRGIRQASLNATGHPLTTTVPEGLPLVLADPAHLERVLGNLIENAAKYSPEGAPIAVEVATEGGDVVFAVRDRGTGLTPEEQSHLFERFYRSPRVKHRTPGTGLGLAICKEIVQAHGGRIWAESVEGEGSTFRFTLPTVA